MLKLYLDANVWCRPFDEQKQKRIIEETDAFFKVLQKADKKEIAIIGSEILIEELEAIQHKEKRELVEMLIEMTVSKWIDAVPDLYKDLMKTGLKLADSIHLACAVENAKYFISVDDDILKGRKEIEKLYNIKVVNPTEFMELEGE